MFKFISTFVIINGLIVAGFSQSQTLNSNGSSYTDSKINGVYSFGETFVGSETASFYGSQGFITGSKILKTSIEDHNGQIHEIIVYPNPTLDHIKIKTQIELVSYRIYDNTGKQIIHNNYNLGEQIDLSSLVPGLYLLTVESKTSHKIKVGYINKI